MRRRRQRVYTATILRRRHESQRCVARRGARHRRPRADSRPCTRTRNYRRIGVACRWVVSVRIRLRCGLSCSSLLRMTAQHQPSGARTTRRSHSSARLDVVTPRLPHAPPRHSALWTSNLQQRSASCCGRAPTECRRCRRFSTWWVSSAASRPCTVGPRQRSTPRGAVGRQSLDHAARLESHPCLKLPWPAAGEYRQHTRHVAGRRPRCCHPMWSWGRRRTCLARSLRTWIDPTCATPSPPWSRVCRSFWWRRLVYRRSGAPRCPVIAPGTRLSSM